MVELFAHQRLAVHKLVSGCILHGGVGSGKSMTGLAWYWTKVLGWPLEGERPAGPLPCPLYIITTARKRDTMEWEAELERFGLSSREVVIDSWNRIGQYADISSACFLFDEQRVVGSGKWVKAFLAIAKRNQWLLLSATPGDTWSDYIPVFVANGFYKNRTEFLRQHAIFSTWARFPQIIAWRNEARLRYLRDQILVDMVYEKKTSLHHQDVMTAYNVSLYKQVLKTRQHPDTGEPLQDAGALCGLLRRIVNSDSSRLAALADILEEHTRLIVFYNYNYELELLRNWCQQSDIPFAEWNGHLHQPLPSGPKWVYLVQYAAGAEGWNCTDTDCIVFFSQSYSYRATAQAAGRIDRLNTPYEDLWYYHLLSSSGIDAAIREALDRKTQFNENRYFEGLSASQLRRNARK